MFEEPSKQKILPTQPYNCHDLHEKSKEKNTVNVAKSGAIPYLQRRLNQELKLT